MACCKCCCGNKDCSQGDQGKCCCGTTTKACCTASEYCCDGECKSTPCTGACCDATFGCSQSTEANCTGEGVTFKGLGVSCDPNPCGCETDEDCAATEGYCCCNGECVTCPTICVLSDIDGCGHTIYYYITNVSEATCNGTFAGSHSWYYGTDPVTIPAFTSDSSLDCDDPVNNPSYTFNPCDVVSTMAVKQDPPDDGPGTELKKLLSKIGITASPGCSCNKRAETMNRHGTEWCENNIETICDWLQEEATKRKLPFVRLAGKALIHLAIRRAKKGNKK